MQFVKKKNLYPNVNGNATLALTPVKHSEIKWYITWQVMEPKLEKLIA